MTDLMLVDSHCHLSYDGLVDQIPAVIERAHQEGVTHMLCICSHLSEFELVSQVAETNDNVFCSIGVHPHDCAKEPEVDVQTLVSLADHPKTIGIGETGLDFYYDNSPRDLQEKNFRTHIGAARETGLPVIIHTRNADEKMISVLQEEFRNGPFSGVIHCFSAGEALAKTALELGFFISLSGIITFKNANELRAMVKSLPLNRILVETDSPFLAPVPVRGKRNEPAFVVHTVKKLAEMFAVSFEEIAGITTQNFFNLFGKAQPSDK